MIRYFLSDKWGGIDGLNVRGRGSVIGPASVRNNGGGDGASFLKCVF